MSPKYERSFFSVIQEKEGIIEKQKEIIQEEKEIIKKKEGEIVQYETEIIEPEKNEIKQKEKEFIQKEEEKDNQLPTNEQNETKSIAIGIESAYHLNIFCNLFFGSHEPNDSNGPF